MLRRKSLILCVLISCALASSAAGRNNPIKPARRAGHPVAGSAAAEGLECGTYKGNHAESRWAYHEYRNTKRRLGLNPGEQLAATDFVYDDCLIVEDDGTIIVSGTNTFDTQATTFRFTPNGSGGYDITTAPFVPEPPVGTDLALGDDASAQVALGFGFDFYGATWDSVYVNSNGTLEFGAVPNPSGFYDSNDFFNEVPKMAPYFMDLNPSAGGTVLFIAHADRIVITWQGVFEFGTSLANTFQAVLHDDHTFDLTYGGISSTTQQTGSPVTVGIHPGGMPAAERIRFSADIPFSSADGTTVYETYYSLTSPLVNDVALGQHYYQTYADDIFQFVFFTNFTQTMAGFANEVNIENGVTGIGLPIFDNSALYGSNGVLESRCNMNQMSAWFTNPEQRFANLKANNFLTVMGQESGHRWGAFMNFMDSQNNASNLILGRADAHWSYYIDVDHSSLEGGNWDEVSPGTYQCPTQVNYFSELDQYAMGLRTPEEVSPTFFVSSASNNLPQNRSVGTPPQGAVASGTPVAVTVEDIIAAEGPRTPLEPDEDKDLRQAFILVVLNGTSPSQADLDKLAGFRRAWEPYFERSVQGRLTVNTSITQTFPAAVISGHARDRTTQQPVPDLTVVSVEREFEQYVIDGGRFTFRYLADENSGTLEWTTLIFSAPGYYPDSMAASVAYNWELPLDVWLTPVPTTVEPGMTIPDALYQNTPNPFNPATTIRYDLSRAGRVRLVVYDVLGRKIRTLVDASRPAGHNDVRWDGTNDAGRAVASGIYLYRLETDTYARTRKMHLIQ